MVPHSCFGPFLTSQKQHHDQESVLGTRNYVHLNENLISQDQDHRMTDLGLDCKNLSPWERATLA